MIGSTAGDWIASLIASSGELCNLQHQHQHQHQHQPATLAPQAPHNLQRTIN